MRKRTIKADGDLVDMFEDIVRGKGTWNEAIKTSIDNSIALNNVKLVLNKSEFTDSEKLKYIEKLMGV